MSRPWTPAQHEKLIELIGLGWTHQRIGEEIGRTVMSVGWRAQKFRIHNPEAVKRNALAAQRAAWADRSAMVPVIYAIKASWTPERRARQAQIARETTAKRVYRPPTPAVRSRMTAGIKEWHRRRWAWLPADLRPAYDRIARKHGAAVAREAVQRMIAEREAALSPFERQMAKVRAGAGIVEIRPIRTAESVHSLTGCSMAMVAYG